MADGKVVIKATLDGSDAQSGVSKLKGLLGGLEQTGSRIGSVFKSVLGANLISSALTSGLSAVSSGVRGIIGNLNDSTAAWASFEGNMKNLGVADAEIKKVSASLQDYAKKTIYSSSEMASTYAQLRATGVEGTEDLVKAFGNLAGSAENPAQAMKSLSQQATQMTANSKVQFADFRIMAQQAPAAMAEVAKKMGMTYGELTTAIKDGKVATADFFEAVKQAGAAGSEFEKMATKPKTISQALDTLTDGISNKLLPHFAKFNQAGIDFISGISDAVDNLNFDGIFAKVNSVVTSIVSRAKAFWTAFSNTGAVAAFLSAVQSVGSALSHVFESLGSSGALSTLGSALGNIVKWLSQAAMVAGNFIKSMPTGAVKGIAGSLLGLIVGFKAFNFLKGFNPFSFFKKSAETGMSGATQAIGRARSTIAQTLRSLASIIRSIGSSVAAAAKGIGSGLATAFRGIGQALAIANPVSILAVGGAIAVVVASLTLLATQGQGVATIIQSVGTAFGTVASMLIGAFAQAIVTVAGVLPIVASSLSLLSPLVRALGDAFATVITAVGEVAPQFAILATAIGGAISQIIGAISGLVGAFTPIIQIISDTFIQVTQIVTDAIVQIVQAIAPFIPSLTAMVQAVAPVLQSMVEAFSKLIEQVSPILDSLTQLLQTFGEQVSSILESAGSVVESFGSAIRNVLDGVAGIFESMGNAAKNAGQGVKLMAQGIKILVDLKLGDLTATLTAVAGGLTAIASSGIATAGPGLQQAGIGLRLIATSAQVASTAIQGLPASLMSLSNSLGTLPTTLTTVSTAASVFARSLLTSFASLVGSTVGITLLQSRLTALNGSMTITGAMARLMISAFSTSAAAANLLGVSLGSIPSKLSAIGSAGVSSMALLSTAIRTAIAQSVSTVRSGMTQMVSIIRLSAAMMTQAGLQAGRGVASGITAGIRSGIGQASSAMLAMMASIRSVGMSGVGVMRSIGAYIGQGLAQGMYSALGSVTAAANALVAQAERAARAKAQIHSPSRLFRDNVGRYIAQGIAVGIKQNTSDVTKSLDYVQEEMMKYRLSPEKLLSSGQGSMVLNTTLKQGVERAASSQVEKVKQRAEELTQKALEVAEKAVERPLTMVMDTGAVVGSIGGPMTAYQEEKVLIDNMMRGYI